MLGTKQTFDEEKGGQAKREPPAVNFCVVIYLLVTIIILLLCVLTGMVVFGVQMHIKSNSKEVTDMEDMARDMKQVMPQIKTFVPQITTAMGVGSSELNVTELMHKLRGFDDMARDMKSIIPQIKTFVPQITTAMDNLGSSEFNVTGLLTKLKDFDALADKLKDFDAMANRLLTNPVSVLLDGVFEANTDVSRWRAVALKASDILQKLSKVDYSVSLPEFKWDELQDCDGSWDNPNFEGHDDPKYKTETQSACNNFQLDAVASQGYGTCVYENNKCEDKDKEFASYRWIRNVHSSARDVIGQETSNDLQSRFVQIRKFTSDFGGDPSKVSELKSESMIDLPLWLNMFMGSIQPQMMQNVVDATDFLEKQSISKIICDPKGGKKQRSSCTWLDEGYVSNLDIEFKTIVGIVRTVAKNVHKVWSA